MSKRDDMRRAYIAQEYRDAADKVTSTLLKERREIERAAATAERERVLAELEKLLHPWRKHARKWSVQSAFVLLDELGALIGRMREYEGSSDD